MNIFKTNKFFRVIKHFILCLPLMFVLGVSLYAIVNPNAKDSYYGETINEVQYTSITSFSNNESYYLNVPITNRLFQSVTSFIYCDNLQVISASAQAQYDNLVAVADDVAYIRFQNNGTSNSYLSFRNNNDETLLNVNVKSTSLVFTIDVINTFITDDYIYSYSYLITYNEYSYLNNAFEYGMYQFTQIGFGQFDFVSLFNGIFTTNINNVYASFINDYINYYLFVEVIYFAPWVFHMFIHFAYDLGDYFTSSFKRNRKEDD